MINGTFIRSSLSLQKIVPLLPWGLALTSAECHHRHFTVKKYLTTKFAVKSLFSLISFRHSCLKSNMLKDTDISRNSEKIHFRHSRRISFSTFPRSLPTHVLEIKQNNKYQCVQWCACKIKRKMWQTGVNRVVVPVDTTSPYKTYS